MKCDGFNEDSYAFYALGGEPGDEGESIAEHLKLGCLTCAHEMSAYQNVWYSVALAAPQAKPSRSLRRRILKEVGGQKESRWSWAYPAMTCAAAVVAVAVGWLTGASQWNQQPPVFSPQYAAAPSLKSAPVNIPAAPRESLAANATPHAPQQQVENSELATLRVDLARERARSADLEAQMQKPALVATAAPESDSAEQRYRKMLDDRKAESESLRTQLIEASTRVSTLERSVAQYQTLLEVERRRNEKSTMIASMVTSPALRVIPLKGTERGPGIEGRVMISGTSQMILALSHLPALPANRVYQLWMLRSKAPAVASAGTFRPDGNSQATIQLQNSDILGDVTAVAVTDEPAGGSVRPTGQKWALGL